MIALSYNNAALRPISLRDAADVLQHCVDAELAANVGDSFPHPYTPAHAQDFCRRQEALIAPYTNLGIVVNDRLVGSIGIVEPIDQNSTTAMLGYWVGASARGQGLAPQALIAYADYVLTNWPRLERLEALAFIHNNASRRVLEKAGFSHTATLPQNGRFKGQPVDDVVYSRPRHLTPAL